MGWDLGNSKVEIIDDFKKFKNFLKVNKIYFSILHGEVYRFETGTDNEKNYKAYSLEDIEIEYCIELKILKEG